MWIMLQEVHPAVLLLRLLPVWQYMHLGQIPVVQYASLHPIVESWDLNRPMAQFRVMV